VQLSQLPDLTAIDPTLVQVDPTALPDPSAVNSYLDVPPLSPGLIAGTDTSTIDGAVNQAASSASSGGSFNLSQFITNLADATATVAKAVNSGTAAVNTAVHPAPGTTRMLPNGSTMVTNADGSSTITSPTGARQTILPNGKIVAGGAPMLAGLGLSNQALAIGAAAILGLFLVMRRR
jgi:hypothetical protein